MESAGERQLESDKIDVDIGDCVKMLVGSKMVGELCKLINVRTRYACGMPLHMAEKR